MNQNNPFTDNNSMGNSYTHHSTIINYAKTCIAPFDEEPFNEVDSLILSWIAYLRIPEEVLPKKPLNSPVQPDNPIFTDTDSCTISELLKKEYYGQMLYEVWSPGETLEMLYALSESPRFRTMRLCMRREELDPRVAKQFAAITFQVRPDLTYIAFRGTDKTMTGWEEDFRLCLEDPVPAQMLGAEYLSAVGTVFRGKLIVGGHSKGGNLAVFAAANCRRDVQDRIENVYSHDGPGFLKSDLVQEGFRRIQPRIRKTAPQFSVFGFLMHQETEPKIIYSYENGILQHNPTSWKTEGYGFSKYWYPDRISQTLKNKLNNWLDGLSNEERRMFIDTLFNILDQTGFEKFGDLQKNLPEVIPIVIREFSRLDPSMKMFLVQLVQQFIFASEVNHDPNADLSNLEKERQEREKAEREKMEQMMNPQKKEGDELSDLMNKYNEQTTTNNENAQQNVQTSHQQNTETTNAQENEQTSQQNAEATNAQENVQTSQQNTETVNPQQENVSNSYNQNHAQIGSGYGNRPTGSGYAVNRPQGGGYGYTQNHHTNTQTGGFGGAGRTVGSGYGAGRPTGSGNGPTGSGYGNGTGNNRIYTAGRKGGSFGVSQYDLDLQAAMAELEGTNKSEEESIEDLMAKYANDPNPLENK